MAENCDPLAGWSGIHHKWAHCRDGEEACLTIELLSVTSAYAYVGVDPSWRGKEGRAINKGEYIEYLEGDTVWRVYCDGVSTSQDLASIRICYEEPAPEPEPEPEDGMKVGDTRRVDGSTFKLTKIICTPVQQITAWVDGLSKPVKLGAFAVFPGVFVAGGIYIGLKAINAACDMAIVEASGGGLTPSDVVDIDDLLEAEYTRPDGTKPTPEEIHKVKMKVIDGFDWTDPKFVEMVEKLLAGTISREEFVEWMKQYTIDNTKTGLDKVYYTANFSLNISSVVMAGEVKVSGTAPQPNQELQIMAVKKFFGFDYLASDTELARVTSDADYQYEAILELNEFGIIEVYARIPKDWWSVLTADTTTPKHTVFVLTWSVLVFLIIAAALVYDKSSGGKLRKMLKR